MEEDIPEKIPKSGFRVEKMTSEFYIICCVYKILMTTLVLVFVMSILVDNFPLELSDKPLFFHRRLCHKVEM